MIDNATGDKYKIYKQVCNNKYLYKGSWRGVIAIHVAVPRLQQVEGSSVKRHVRQR